MTNNPIKIKDVFGKVVIFWPMIAWIILALCVTWVGIRKQTAEPIHRTMETIQVIPGNNGYEHGQWVKVQYQDNQEVRVFFDPNDINPFDQFWWKEGAVYREKKPKNPKLSTGDWFSLFISLFSLGGIALMFTISLYRDKYSKIRHYR